MTAFTTPRVGLARPRSRRAALVLLAALGLTAAAAPFAALAALEPMTARVSVDSAGNAGNAPAGDPAVSDDGQAVAFAALADSLVSGDTNGVYDVFVRDRRTAETKRVSVSSSGEQGNGPSQAASIAADGRAVAFESGATNLVPGDTNAHLDVFVHDRTTLETMRVSVATGGSQATGDSEMPDISADGRYVAFGSSATDLVQGDTNGTWDVFVHDRASNVTTRVSVATGGGEAGGASELAAIADDGRTIAFHSAADNLVPDDTNASWDIYVHDLDTGVTERVSVDSAGAEAGEDSFMPSLSADGRFVAFFSRADDLVPEDTNEAWDVFVHDRTTGVTERISVPSDGAQGDGHSGYPIISASGRYVAFDSQATNLVANDTNGIEDVFVHDRTTRHIERVSVATGGAEADDASASAAIARDGRTITFHSAATNLVPGDTNLQVDVFARDRWPVAPWDINRDGIVNSLDVGLVGLHWQASGAPGWIPEDVNRDGVVNSLDVGLIGLHWQETT